MAGALALPGDRLALLVLVVILGYIAFQHLSGAASQDPGLSSLPAFR